MLTSSWKTAVFAVLVALVIVGWSGTSQAANWPQFLGPQRNGVSAEAGLIDSFSAAGPRELWRIDAAGGMSGVSIADGSAFTMTQDANHQYVLCVDAATGEMRWQTPVGAIYENSMGDGPRATPTVSRETVFAYTGDGRLAALSSKDGSILWQIDAVKENGGKIADYGMSCSPLVVGEMAVVSVGASEATLAAYDLQTGQRKWTSGTVDAAGYSSPVLAEVAGEPQIVAFTGGSAIGVNPTSGERLWRYPYETDYHCNTASPVAINGQVLLSAGENHGSVLLAVGENGSISETWSALGPRAEFRSEWQTPVQVDGFLYAFDNVGSAGSVTHLTCINAATGKPVWQQKRFGKGNLIAADGKLWITTMKGELVLATASPAGFDEVSRATVCGETRQAPALAGGRLYLRDGKQLICLDVRRSQ